ncbi:hypothetical protein [Nocardiopsis potens]|uniref:hypothetical protein n=1 Tax=Nocardiopsis potens TaxID=1246458 RepID=UPI00034BBF03|nr:hypothetical protein [Nocardiopsis potens]
MRPILRGLSAGALAFAVAAAASACSPGEIGRALTGDDPNETTDVSGIVLDSSGEPVAGVFISPSYLGDEPILIQEIGHSSGSGGRWTVPLQRGPWELQGIKDGRRTGVVGVVVDEEDVADGTGVDGVELRFP